MNTYFKNVMFCPFPICVGVYPSRVDTSSQHKKSEEKGNNDERTEGGEERIRKDKAEFKAPN